MTQRAHINPDILKWARESAHMSVEEVALCLKVKTDRIEKWESGEAYPTIRQMETFTMLFRRPLAVFFLPEPPKDFHTLRDFRKKDKQAPYSRALIFIIRDILQRQEWMGDFLQDQDEPELDFIGKYSRDDDPKAIASDIRETLKIHDIPTGKNPLNFWIEKIENKGIFVSLTGNVHSHLPVDPDEVKGFSASDKYAPFIFVNTKDSKNSQLFTLVHELAHLWLDISGVSAFDMDFRMEQDKFDPLEIHCNAITAEVLMPEDMIKSFFQNQDINLNIINKMAEQLHVSSYAMIVRLLNLGILPEKTFYEYRAELNRQYGKYLEQQETKEKKEGGPDYYLLQVRKNSRLFSRMIYFLYKGGEISGVEAGNLLNIRLNNFNKMEKYILV
jgi:Zn-dependent peptidase ImmA (M78 family)